MKNTKDKLRVAVIGTGYLGKFHAEKYARMPESKRIIAAVAIGYPDWDFPANKLETEREPVQNTTTWLGFN
ncbi:MAG: hypothetical protein ABFS02_07385 [Pseudomonadota bacterium]